MKYGVTTFFTSDYRAHANRLGAALAKYNVPFCAIQESKKGSWGQTTSLSASTVARSQLPVLWLDADAQILREPNIPFQGPEDILAPRRKKGILGRPWSVYALFFRDTVGAKLFIRRWAHNSRSAKNPLCTDDYYFHRTLREMGPMVKIGPLDTSWMHNKISGKASKTKRENAALKKVNAYWARTPRPGNFGDVITPWMIRLETGEDPTWAAPKPGTVMGAGSIIRFAAGCKVWGSGIMWKKDKLHPKNEYCGVRGPLTRDKVKADVPIGDPGLLLPLFYDVPVEKEVGVGVVAHYRHTREANAMGFHVINPLCKNPRKVIDDIRACQYICSSSLHGLIAAEAYGIPWKWVTFSGKLSGDGSKFQDFFQSIPLKPRIDSPFFIEKPGDLKEGKFVVPSTYRFTHMDQWEACPFRLDNRKL
jgi:hypothetical protein